MCAENERGTRMNFTGRSSIFFTNTDDFYTIGRKPNKRRQFLNATRSPSPAATVSAAVSPGGSLLDVGGLPSQLPSSSSSSR